MSIIKVKFQKSSRMFFKSANRKKLHNNYCPLSHEWKNLFLIYNWIYYVYILFKLIQTILRAIYISCYKNTFKEDWAISYIYLKCTREKRVSLFFTYYVITLETVALTSINMANAHAPLTERVGKELLVSVAGTIGRQGGVKKTEGSGVRGCPSSSHSGYLV